ncbi:MAG: hypothetical protein Q7T68_15785 [Sphingopyxis sp.]|nr:hypothetical protein [Sphingopyxis sp.]
MLAEISAGIGSLKALKDVVQGLNAANVQAQINEVKISLQEGILQAYEALLAAQERETASLTRMRDLEQEIVGLKDWSAERKRYQLVDAYRGAFTYMPKRGMENGQPAHWLCTNCFEQGRKSFLQNKGLTRGTTEVVYGCDNCKGSLTVSARTKPHYPGDEDA